MWPLRDADMPKTSCPESKMAKKDPLFRPMDLLGVRSAAPLSCSVVLLLSNTNGHYEFLSVHQHLKIHHTSQQHNAAKTCRIRINGIEIDAEPDSGSDTNIMDEQQFKLLTDQVPETQLRSSKIKLKTLKEELPIIGELDVTIANQNRETKTTLVIIAGTIDSPPLIGRPTLEELGMLLIDETGGLRHQTKLSNP